MQVFSRKIINFHNNPAQEIINEKYVQTWQLILPNSIDVETIIHNFRTILCLGCVDISQQLESELVIVQIFELKLPCKDCIFKQLIDNFLFFYLL